MRSMVFAEALLPEGWRRDVRVEVDADGRIATVTPDAAPGRLVALPGMPDLHSHAFQRGMAGLTEHAGASDDSFWTWRELMYRFLAHLTPEDVEAIATLAYAEMLEGGFTRVGEFHYLHHAPDGTPHADRAEMAVRIAAAAQATGINLTLLPSFYAHGEIGGAPPVPGQRRFLNDLDGFAALVEGSRRAIAGLPGANLGLAPHSLRAATIEEIRAVAAMARHGEPLHIHAAEQVKEVEASIRILGLPPIAALLEAGLLSDRWCLIHATHGTAGELAQVAACGAVSGLCPVTESNLGDGIFPAPGFREAGGLFGVGTDSNVLISAPLELRTLEYSQRLALRSRNVLAPRGGSTGQALWQSAVAGGSRALAAGPAGIAPGAWADLVLLDPAAPAFAARSGERMLDSLLFAARDGAIHEVWVRGTRVVADGVHPLRARAERRVAAILARILAA
ncbi:formimidoylglutamate deiminase [Neoroseomonas oryzicola]|uniref:Formimidoylglutamate deiminase n=1 Tax=Neoroseomonas oryzicola TaxID=535904 RepID=A0A9X9WBJ9_9PROT|nr:formimidoylglutamate deiminase [Neoroseomonas oryzicola]MBR0657709.1 formimidoylglutamate deiminase [Neoroseomonas oryzicola]NKE18965.1 formimidoylglutamate deiminase [Neoroseomonas oryzicola]